MRSTTPMKIAKLGYIGMSLITLALGICLICVPDISAQTMGWIFGIMMVVFGLIKLVGFFSGDLFRLAFQYDLAAGILMIMTGCALLFRPISVLSFFCMLLGLMVLADGLFKIQITMEAKRFGIRYWWVILLSAVLAGGLGFLLVLFPENSVRALTVLLGIVLAAESILNFCTVMIAVKIIRNQRPDVIELEHSERKD